MRVLIATIVLFFVFSSVSHGETSEPIKPVPQEEFTYIKPIVDPVKRSPLPTKPALTTKEAEPEVILKIPIVKKITVKATGNSFASGFASWYCRAGQSPCRSGYPDTAHPDYYAAAGPALRIAFGGRESSKAYVGKFVKVCNVNKACVTVKLIDWCQCFYKTAQEKVLDLYYDAYKAILPTGSSNKIKVYRQ